ncbi:MAG: PH domain-containing protein [Synergistales bacterium]|nr:PH domain-containing protein [Synergistales bacterium]
MGLISGMMGNASVIEPAELAKEYTPLLAEGESLQIGFRLIRDTFIFTDKRLILVDKQGITGKKIEYHSIPYDKITNFSIETSGHFDLDAELKIWISGRGEPFAKQFSKKVNIYDVQKVLATNVLK